MNKILSKENRIGTIFAVFVGLFLITLGVFAWYEKTEAQNIGATILLDTSSDIVIQCQDAPLNVVYTSDRIARVSCASPVPTVTSLPIATDTPLPTIPPTTTIALELYPPCSVHDNTKWHALYDTVKQCHYDHTHDVDPNHPNTVNYLVNSATGRTFGPIEAFTGQQIGYVWQTNLENTNKHSGYHFASALNLPCEQQNYNYLLEMQRNCIKAFRATVHAAGPMTDGPSRFHSYSMEIVTQDRQTQQIGYIASGGVFDTDDAHSPYKTTCVEILGSNRSPCPSPEVWKNQLNNPPYWAFTTYESAMNNLRNGYLCRQPQCRSLPSNKMVWDNISADRPDSLGNRMGAVNHLIHFNARQYSASAAYSSTIKGFVYVCPDGSCIAMNDSFFIYAVVAYIPSSLDEDGNGWVENYQGFTDRAGNVRTKSDCPQVNVECIPLIVQNVRVGNHIYDTVAPFLPPFREWGDGVITQKDEVRYFDTTPPTLSKSWVDVTK